MLMFLEELILITILIAIHPLLTAQSNPCNQINEDYLTCICPTAAFLLLIAWQLLANCRVTRAPSVFQVSHTLIYVASYLI